MSFAYCERRFLLESLAVTLASVAASLDSCVRCGVLIPRRDRVRRCEPCREKGRQEGYLRRWGVVEVGPNAAAQAAQRNAVRAHAHKKLYS